MSNYFGAYWKSRPLSFGDYIESLKYFLSALQQLHPLFKGLHDVGNKPNDETPIADDLSNITAIAMERAWDRKAPRKWYSELSSEKHPTLNAISETGYGMTMANGDKVKKGSDYVYVSVYAGMSSPFLNNSVVIMFSESDDAPFSDSELATRILELMVEHWHPDSALVTAEDFRDLTHSQDDGACIGWMTYFANPAVAAVLPAAVDHRPFGSQGGVLLTTAPRIPSASDAEAAATAIKVAEILRSQNLMV